MSLSLGFIFMATRDDRTVPEARRLIDRALALGVRNIGFKDIGQSRQTLKELAEAIRGGGAQVFFEIVSLDRESEMRSVANALEFGVDWLMGGRRAQDVAPIALKAGVSYAPFPGDVVGHPSRLIGTLEAIVADARALLEIDGVNGLDLLAYRWQGDAPELIRRVAEISGKPLIVAGSVDSPARIAAVAEAGASGFTIGSALIAGAFPAPAPDFEAQVQAVQTALAAA